MGRLSGQRDVFQHSSIVNMTCWAANSIIGVVNIQIFMLTEHKN